MKIYQIEGLSLALERAGLNWNKTPLVDHDPTYAGTGIRFIITKNQTGDCEWYHNGNTGIASFNNFPFSINAPAQDATNPYNILFTYNTIESVPKMYYTNPAAIPDTLSIDSTTEILIAQFQVPAVGNSVSIPTEAEKPTQSEIQLAIDSTDVNAIENTKRTTARSLWYFWNYAKTKITSLLLTGLSVPSNYTDIVPTDSILTAFGKVAKILSSTCTTSLKGLMSAGDKTKLDSISPIWNTFISTINTTPSSTSTIDRLNSGIDFTSFLKIGYGIKYKIAGTYYFGRIVGITASQLIIEGIPLSGTIQELYYGLERDVIEKVCININNSDWIVGTSNILIDGYTAYPFHTPNAYLTSFRIWSKVVDSGTKSAIKVLNGANNITPSLTNGLILTANKTFYSSGVNMSSSYYSFAGDTILRIDTYSPGNKDTTDAIIELYFVYE